MDFEYKIVTQNDVAVVTFKGKFSTQAISQLETCHQEVVGLSSKMIILFFKDVDAFDQPVLRNLTLLQQEIRKKSHALYLVGLNQRMRQFLYDKGVIRLGELKNSLEDVFT